MPAVSQAQREMLNAHFGHEWVKAHGFDNKGKLPARVNKKKEAKMKKGKKHKISMHDVPGGSSGHHGGHASHTKMNKAHGTPGGFDAGEEYGGKEHDKGLKHDATHMNGHSITTGASGMQASSGGGSDGPGIPDIEGNSSEG